ncbi:hypothetical protein LRS13_03260 [Svornostia abyssi]|uniref:MCE family protein n=1 Tax=Svornostia abyssi TaxID=2898438 RepID=A0ABY5PIR6_9ACTN|nr:hypothetical protein LRS13_03260 [Parviterribacteraceae bacterium J379]
MTRARQHRRARPFANAAGRLTAHPRLLGLVVVAIAAVGAYIVALSVNGVPFQDRYRVTVQLPPGAPPLDENDQVRIAGQRAGLVRTTRPGLDGTELDIEMTGQYWPLGDQTTAMIRVKPGTGLTFIDLRPAGSATLPEGGVIPASRVRAGTTLTDVAETFTDSTQRAMSGTIVSAGSAVAGQGDDLNAALRELPRVLDEGVPLLDALTPRPGELAGLLTDGGQVAGALGASGQLPSMLENTSETVGALDRRRDDLGRLLDRTPPAFERLVAVEPRLAVFLARLERLVGDVSPMAESLERELPALRRLLATGPTLQRAAQRLGPAAAQALASAPDAMTALDGPVQLIPPLVDEIDAILAVLLPYKADLRDGVAGLTASTSIPFAEGPSAPGSPVVRAMPGLACSAKRNPYPEPGAWVEDKGERGKC